MADNVVIAGVKRGPSLVSSGELRQMAGRAGRVHGGADARVEVIVAEEEADYARDALAPGHDPIVGSAMGDPDVMAFHLLPEICAGKASDAQKAALWRSRSFYAALGMPAILDDAMAVLRACGAIEDVSGRVLGTALGRVASSMYFHPADIEAWADNFTELFQLGLDEDDQAAAWALGNVSIKRHSGDFGNKFWVVCKFADELSHGLEARTGSLVTCVLWWSVMGGPSAGPMKGHALQLKDDRQRVFGALRRLDREVMHWGKIDYFDRLEFQTAKSIPVEIVPLCHLPGVGKGLAMRLYEMGIEGPQDVLREADLKGPLCDDELGMIARGLVDGYC